jgi:aminoglycoside phosphotransferase (APT) family kinase protein
MIIDEPLVRRLIAAQFPEWSDLPIRPVASSGWDNRTFHLGDEMSVRLPSSEAYVPQVDKEHRWLPVLAPNLPLPRPSPIAKGAPGEGFPWPWSIYRWLDGERATRANIADLNAFAADLANFLVALRGIDAKDGPLAGKDNFYRGGPLGVYAGETAQAVAALGDEIDRDRVMTVWDEALATTWQGRPVWVHGDVADGNLLVNDGKLTAVIDFGSSGVGDPACDLYIAWTFLDQESRQKFRAGLALNDATWARGRGWTLWKTLITLAEHGDAQPLGAWARRVIGEVLADHERAT